MPVSLPQVLSTDDDEPAIAQLHRYYGPAFGSSNAYTGSAFDAWDSTGTRENDVNRFTADDVVAVIFLSVEVTPKAAHALLQAQADRFSGLLEDVGPDRDLVDDDAVLDDNWAGWTLDRELRNLPGVGHTTANLHRALA